MLNYYIIYIRAQIHDDDDNDDYDDVSASISLQNIVIFQSLSIL